MTNQYEFLPKDAEKALFAVKEKLYERLAVLRQCLQGCEKDDYGYIDEFDIAYSNEIQFLENVLDIIERS